MKAHKQKRSLYGKTPLVRGGRAPVAPHHEPRRLPYLRLNRATHLVGMVGLNEMVQQHTGEEMHASKRALRFGPQDHRPPEAPRATRCREQENMRIVLEQTPAETTSYRFAKLDFQQFFPASAKNRQGRHLLGRGLLHQLDPSECRRAHQPHRAGHDRRPFPSPHRGGFHLPRVDRRSRAFERKRSPTSSSRLSETPRTTRSPFRRSSPPVMRATGRRGGLSDTCPHCASRRCRRHHPDHRLFHEGFQLEQGQAGGAQGPLPQQRVLLVRRQRKAV